MGNHRNWILCLHALRFGIGGDDVFPHLKTSWYLDSIRGDLWWIISRWISFYIHFILLVNYHDGCAAQFYLLNDFNLWDVYVGSGCSSGYFFLDGDVKYLITSMVVLDVTVLACFIVYCPAFKLLLIWIGALVFGWGTKKAEPVGISISICWIFLPHHIILVWTGIPCLCCTFLGLWFTYKYLLNFHFPLVNIWVYFSLVLYFLLPCLGMAAVIGCFWWYNWGFLGYEWPAGCYLYCCWYFSFGSGLFPFPVLWGLFGNGGFYTVLAWGSLEVWYG